MTFFFGDFGCPSGRRCSTTFLPPGSSLEGRNHRDRSRADLPILSVYPETLNLKVQIVIQPVKERPLLVIEENDHQLAIEQASGITRDRALALASLLLHQGQRGLPEIP